MAHVSERILVGVRVRPSVRAEKSEADVVSIKDNVMTLQDQTGKAKTFTFDSLLDSRIPSSKNYASQESVYNVFGSRIIDHVLQGYSSALFAYGQTGTGKTTTIVGQMQPPSAQGLIPRMILDMFDQFEQLDAKGTKVNCRIQMLELYNEQVRDLLNPRLHDLFTKNNKQLKGPEVHVHPKLGVYLTNVEEPVIASPSEAMALIEYGATTKAVAATAMNRHSSRSHTLIKFHVEQRTNELTTSGEAYVVDLAGRENDRTTQVSGERLVELSFINRSLMWLTFCIKNLGAPCEKTSPPASPSQHTPRSGDHSESAPKREVRVELESDESTNQKGPGAEAKHTSKNSMAMFRNSKLTLLLANALNGNSRTAVITTVTPAVVHYEETLSTLKFACAVKNIEMRAQAATQVDKDQMVGTLQEEVARLKSQLAQSSNSAVIKELTDRAKEAETLCALKSESWEEMKRKSVSAMHLREEAVKKLGILRWGYAIARVSRAAGEAPQEANPEPSFPHLVNESEDAFLCGRLVISLPSENVKYAIGSGEDCHFKIVGLGISDTVCHIWRDSELWLQAARPSNRVTIAADPDEPCAGSATSEKEHQVHEGSDPFSSGQCTSFVAVAKSVLEKSRSKAGVNVRVCVNSRPVGVDCVKLKHGDAVSFGHGDKYLFRVRLDNSELDGPKCTPRKVSLDSADMEALLGERATPEDLKAARRYWAELHRQADGETDADFLTMQSGFLKTVRETQRQVEEANSITELLKDSDLEFQLAMESPVLSFGYGRDTRSFPTLCVRLVERIPDVQSKWGLVRNRINTFGRYHHVDASDFYLNENARVSGSELLSIWNVPKFRARLDLMRDAYEAYCRNPDTFTVDADCDPWDEQCPGKFKDIKYIVTREREEQNVKIESLKEELAVERAKSEHAADLETEHSKLKLELGRLNVELEAARCLASVQLSLEHTGSEGCDASALAAHCLKTALANSALLGTLYKMRAETQACLDRTSEDGCVGVSGN